MIPMARGNCPRHPSAHESRNLPKLVVEQIKASLRAASPIAHRTARAPGSHFLVGGGATLSVETVNGDNGLLPGNSQRVASPAAGLQLVLGKAAKQAACRNLTVNALAGSALTL